MASIGHRLANLNTSPYSKNTVIAPSASLENFVSKAVSLFFLDIFLIVHTYADGLSKLGARDDDNDASKGKGNVKVNGNGKPMEAELVVRRAKHDRKFHERERDRKSSATAQCKTIRRQSSF